MELWMSAGSAAAPQPPGSVSSCPTPGSQRGAEVQPPAPGTSHRPRGRRGQSITKPFLSRAPSMGSGVGPCIKEMTTMDPPLIIVLSLFDRMSRVAVALDSGRF
ncbi:hypothetical protein AAFF_G00237570 [Aldrovandia affinis]|uniref:Uncharacterized protein n=1 Tax=Aldrovandia affinis TaxID=143900 RepID=A0AAD7REQ9_9TELE|nr:hypothetical protein AAFF_G00237570 [Aldrovandia affinis]